MFQTLKKLIIGVLPDVWPVIIIITVIACSLRIAYIIKNKKKFCLYRELFNLVFILYVMCLFEVVTSQDANYGSSNLVPFKEIFRYTFGSGLFVRNIVGNILLFMPYGYFISYYVKSESSSLVCVLSLVLSVTIEIVQLKIGRVFDIDDVILNTTGGFLGYMVYYVTNKISNRLPNFLKGEGVINFFVVLVIILIILVMINYSVVSLIG